MMQAMDWLGLLLRPLFLVLLFGTALWIGSAIRRRLQSHRPKSWAAVGASDCTDAT
jgi:hypothetical protein